MKTVEEQGLSVSSLVGGVALDALKGEPGGLCLRQMVPEARASAEFAGVGVREPFRFQTI